MEILLITGIFPPDIGGPATYIPKLADSLTAAGESVKVITLSDKALDEKRAYPVYSVLRKQSFKKRSKEVVQLINSHGITADLIFANGLFAEVYQANKILKKPQINKIVADYAWEVASRKGLTKLDMIGLGRQKNLLFNFLRRAKNYQAVQANSIVTPSFYLKEIINNWNYQTKNIEVIPNGCNVPAQEKLSFKLPNCYLVSAGRLIPFKQFDRLIHLMSEFSNEYHLVIVGEGPQKDSLQQLAKKTNLDDRVYFTGRLTPGETFSVLQKAQVFVLLTKGEAFPHLILEAMAASVPILATNTGGIPEIITHNQNGVLVSSVNQGSLKEAIMPLLEDPTLVKKLTTAGQETLNKFSWEKCFNKTYDLIKKTVTNP